ncbi:MAG: hypothetical protein ACRD03_14600 [Acidimicrobiales bacterium]
MPSTIGWLAVAVAAGALVGLAIGHWPAVAAWVHRIVEDPAPPADEADVPVDDRLNRTS